MRQHFWALSFISFTHADIESLSQSHLGYRLCAALVIALKLQPQNAFSPREIYYYMKRFILSFGHNSHLLPKRLRCGVFLTYR